MLSSLPGFQRKKHLCKQPFCAEGTTPGPLQKLLKQGEYGALGNVPIFESSFLQVTKRGEYINVHKHPDIITMGILASSSSTALSDLLTIAQEKKEQKNKELEIKRIIPTEMVDLFVHDLNKRRLKVQLITGRKYYLQLHAPEEEESFLFEHWIHLIYLLRATRGFVTTAVTSPDHTLRALWKTANKPKQMSHSPKKSPAEQE